MAKILVTGCAGFIGSHLTKRLLSEGHQVVGIDNLNSYYDVELKNDRLKWIGSSSHFKFQKIDLQNKSALSDLFKSESFEWVVHLAAQAGVRYSLTNPQAYIESNIHGFFNVLECCRQQKPERLIYASSSSVYGNASTMPLREDMNTDNPISLYAASKKSNEVMASSYGHLFGLTAVGLRFFTVYGPWGRPDMAPFLFTKSLFAKERIKLFESGNLKRDFTYIDDIVEGILRCLKKDLPQKENTILNIGCSSPVVVKDFLARLESITGIQAQIESAPMQPGDVRETFASVDRLAELTGYRPKVQLAEGLKNFVSWYRDYFKV